MKYGDTLDLSIEKLAFEGKAIAHVDGLVVFVEGGVPGDTVRAFVTKAKKNFAEARTTEVLSPSTNRVMPKCMHFGVCGGCKWQHLEYAAQTRWKREHVSEALQHIGGFADVRVEPTIASEREFFYRNKMEFSFSDARWRVEHELNDDPFTLGMHVPDNFYKVLHIEQCWLQSERSNDVLRATRDFVREHALSVYHNKRHTGYLRFLAIRESATTGEMMVNLVTSTEQPDWSDLQEQSVTSDAGNGPAQHHPDIPAAFAQHLVEACPFVTTIVQNVTSRKAQISRGELERVLCGSGVIHEHLAGLEYEISANSFFQTNTRQAERLYATTAAYARLHPADIVWDLYCGTGTIGLSIAHQVQRVVGIELVEEAIADARRNATRNNIDNAQFVAGDLRALLKNPPSMLAEKPSCIIVDPPRSGMHEDVITCLLAVAPERIVYVSCNPATLARDVKLMSEQYSIARVQPVDMFPHTYHVECVVELRRIGI